MTDTEAATELVKLADHIIAENTITRPDGRIARPILVIVPRRCIELSKKLAPDVAPISEIEKPPPEQ